MSKKNEDYEILSISKKQIIIYYVMMWGGLIVGLLSFFIKNQIVALFTVKCPYCGNKKVGRAISMGMKAPVYCPDCHKRVKLK